MTTYTIKFTDTDGNKQTVKIQASGYNESQRILRKNYNVKEIDVVSVEPQKQKR